MSYRPILFGLMALATASLSLWSEYDWSRVYNSQRRISWQEPSLGRIERRNRTEFHYVGPSKEDVEAFFYFNASAPVGHVERLWNCADQSRPKKLVFIHMSRSAGATVRALLRVSARFCGAGIVTVAHCLDLGREYMEGEEIWTNGKGSQRAGIGCLLMDATDRSGMAINLGGGMRRIRTSLLEQHDIDILTGHLPLGCDEFWHGPDHQPVDSQYLVFLREPLEKYVSRVLLLHRTQNLTDEESFHVVMETAANETRTNGYHETYSNYLVTPAQKTIVGRDRLHWTLERRVNLTMANLVNRSVVVGLTDRMLESLSLVQYLIDAERELDQAIEVLGSSEKMAQIANLSESQNRTKSVVSRIRNDAEHWSQFQEFLKYEYQIWDLGVRIHNAQIETLRQNGWNPTYLVEE